MDTQLLTELIRQAMSRGVLTGENIAINGVPVNQGPEDSEYRPDGWSYETSRGCRRHRLIDERLAELEGNSRVAEFPRWYCFDPMALAGFTSYAEWRAANPPAHSIEAEDEDERLTAARAALVARIRAIWNPANNDHSEGFQVREDTDGDGEVETVTLRDYRVVIAREAPIQEIVDRWPAQALRNLNALAAATGESDWHTP